MELASGGMATVYLARAKDGRDAPLVAIKRPHRHLATDTSFLTMLVDEARLASAIDHPNVVRVRELAFEAREPFIVMDYVEGGSLSEVRRQLSELGRTLQPRLALRIALDALAGLEAAHSLKDDQGKTLGIVHRDVSPHNLLVGCDGSSKLTDFGIAKASDRVQVTREHEVKGKLAYLAPERIDRRRLCTAQSDVFSMAVVLWECIAGRRLFRGEEALETLQEVVSAPIPSLRKLGFDIPQALDDVILRGLARDLDERYMRAAELAAEIEKAAGPDGIAKPYEVADLVEAVFGDELRVRHEMIRRALGAAADVSHVLEVSGLAPRPEPTEEMRERERARLDLLPAVPSAAYAVAASGARDAIRHAFAGRPRRHLAAITIGGLAILGGLVWGLAREAPDADARVAVSAPPRPAVALDEPRRVIVTLPFAASHVLFDGKPVEVQQATSAVVVDVPAGSPGIHHVVAVAPDGARAEASVVEDDGVARPSGGGFVIETLEVDEPPPKVVAAPPKAAPSPRPAGQPSAKRPPSPPPTASVGTVKGGFTKLR